MQPEEMDVQEVYCQYYYYCCQWHYWFYTATHLTTQHLVSTANKGQCGRLNECIVTIKKCF